MDFTFIFLSLFAGVLTIFAPCVFTLLPAIIGTTSSEKSLKRVFVIVASTSISIFIFSLLLRASTLLIDIPVSFWESVSGLILLFFGIITLIPEIWDWINFKLRFSARSNTQLSNASQKQGLVGEILVGASLGPVFTSCSPTYSIVLTGILNESIGFFAGVVYIIFYVLGLALMLSLMGVQGQSLVHKLKWAANPHGVFKRVIGIIFIIVGWSIIFGLHKEIETYLVENISFLNVSTIENNLVEKLNVR